MTVTLSSQGKPFGAVQECGIAFVTQPVIAPPTKAYQMQDLAAYRDHLPLIVGSVAPAHVAAIQSAPTHSQFYPIQGDLNIKAFAARDAEASPWYLNDSMQVYDIYRDPKDIKQLAQMAARIVTGIVQQDEKWFGPARSVNVRYEHGLLHQNDGMHLKEGVSRWHRDNAGDESASLWREYLLRTEFPAHALPNRQTRGMAGIYFDEAQVVGIPQLRPLPGEIMLIAAGPDGTIHCGHRPKPAEGARPSMLLRVIVEP